MNAEKLKSIRDAEKKSHIEIYSSAKIFEKGSWLHKPVKTVMDLVDFFKNYDSINILDLGCGVGRNCIPLAEKFSNINCNIDCVDILEFAIDVLKKNSLYFGVDESINGIVSSIDDYKIYADTYDFIFAVSALEHTDSLESFKDKITEIKHGTKKNGIVCFIVNSEVSEFNKENGESVIPQFEVNIKTEELLSLLNKSFSGWKLINSKIVEQHYDIPRENFISALSTNVVTFVVQKKEEEQF